MSDSDSTRKIKSTLRSAGKQSNGDKRSVRFAKEFQQKEFHKWQSPAVVAFARCDAVPRSPIESLEQNKENKGKIIPYNIPMAPLDKALVDMRVPSSPLLVNPLDLARQRSLWGGFSFLSADKRAKSFMRTHTHTNSELAPVWSRTYQSNRPISMVDPPIEGGTTSLLEELRPMMSTTSLLCNPDVFKECSPKYYDTGITFHTPEQEDTIGVPVHELNEGPPSLLLPQSPDNSKETNKGCLPAGPSEVVRGDVFGASAQEPPCLKLPASVEISTGVEECVASGDSEAASSDVVLSASEEISVLPQFDGVEEIITSPNNEEVDSSSHRVFRVLSPRFEQTKDQHAQVAFVCGSYKEALKVICPTKKIEVPEPRHKRGKGKVDVPVEQENGSQTLNHKRNLSQHLAEPAVSPRRAPPAGRPTPVYTTKGALEHKYKGHLTRNEVDLPFSGFDVKTKEPPQKAARINSPEKDGETHGERIPIYEECVTEAGKHKNPGVYVDELLNLESVSKEVSTSSNMITRPAAVTPTRTVDAMDISPVTPISFSKKDKVCENNLEAGCNSPPVFMTPDRSPRRPQRTPYSEKVIRTPNTLAGEKTPIDLSLSSDSLKVLQLSEEARKDLYMSTLLWSLELTEAGANRGRLNAFLDLSSHIDELPPCCGVPDCEAMRRARQDYPDMLPCVEIEIFVPRMVPLEQLLQLRAEVSGIRFVYDEENASPLRRNFFKCFSEHMMRNVARSRTLKIFLQTLQETAKRVFELLFEIDIATKLTPQIHGHSDIPCSDISIDDGWLAATYLVVDECHVPHAHTVRKAIVELDIFQILGISRNNILKKQRQVAKDVNDLSSQITAATGQELPFPAAVYTSLINGGHFTLSKVPLAEPPEGFYAPPVELSFPTEPTLRRVGLLGLMWLRLIQAVHSHIDCQGLALAERMMKL
eukprot:GHVR01107085.1.p1 GENE.GHVR01107085.1~~GHVR01107085.1.p1  ORF type:complete len:930 (+),score=170.87 GHVR01107085.1:44-2833(+)